MGQANVPQEEVLDPQEAKRRAIEAEEARLAAQRAHGTQVTPETFVDWRKQFDAEQALQKARSVSQLIHELQFCLMPAYMLSCFT